MSRFFSQLGVCGEAGPYDWHCTDRSGHDYSHYDASEDADWNDGQYRDGWYDDAPHHCGSPDCPGREDDGGAGENPTIQPQAVAGGVPVEENQNGSHEAD